MAVGKVLAYKENTIMENQEHMVMLANGRMIPWSDYIADAEAKNASNEGSSHFQRVTSKEPIQ